MAITRVSNLYTVLPAPANSDISSDADEFALQRLSDGRFAVVGETRSQTTELESKFLTIVNATNTANTAVSAFAFDTATLNHEFPLITAGANGTFAVTFDRYGESDSLDADGLAQFYDATGAAVGPLKHGSTSTAGAEFSSSMIRLGNGNYLFTWSDSLNTTEANLDTDVMGRIFDAGGNAVGGEFRINAASAGGQIGNASTALPDGRAFAFWSVGTFEQTQDGPVFNATGLSGRFIDANGTPSGAEISIDALTMAGMDYDDANVAALGNGGFVVAWLEQWDPDVGPRPPGIDDAFRFQVFNSTGVKIGTETVIDTTTTGSITGLKIIELANGGFAASWQVLNGLTIESHVRVYSMTGVEIGTEILLGDVANNGTDGLDEIYDLELMANGQVLGVGYDDGSAGVVGTQIFDFGDEQLLGTAGVDTLYGKDGVNDVISGGAASDLLNGLGGNDTLDGEGGADDMRGGLGNDLYFIDVAGDKAIDTGGIDGIRSSTIALNLTSANYSGIENALLLGATNLALTGSSGANTLTGNSGNNVIDGGGGDDTMYGGLGNDTFVVDMAGDKAFDSGGGDFVRSSTVAINLTSANFSGIEGAYLLGSANLNLIGSGIANTLSGNSGANFIEGLGGADILTGGAGVDRFIFRQSLGAASGNDRITDFTVDDFVRIDSTAVSAMTPLTSNQFVLGTTALDADDRVMYDQTTGVVRFDADGNGAGASIAIFTLDTKPAISFTEFELV